MSLECRPSTTATSSSFRLITHILMAFLLNVTLGRMIDMVTLSDEVTVPQVFFNEQHIGGATQLLHLLESEWDPKAPSDPTPYDKYIELVGSQPNPTDPQLALESQQEDVKVLEATPAENPAGAGPLGTSANVAGGAFLNLSTHTHSSIGSMTSPTLSSNISISENDNDNDNDDDDGEDKVGDQKRKPCEFGCVELQLPSSTTSTTTSSTASSRGSGRGGKSSSSSSRPPRSSPSPRSSCITISLGDLTTELLNILPCHKKIAYNTKYYNNCFLGSECIDKLLQHYNNNNGQNVESGESEGGGDNNDNDNNKSVVRLKTRQEAIQFCRFLQRPEYGPILHHVAGGSGLGSIRSVGGGDEEMGGTNNGVEKGEGKGVVVNLFEDSKDAIYRLQPYQEPHILNSFYLHPKKKPSPPPPPTTNTKSLGMKKSSSKSLMSLSEGDESTTNEGEVESIYSATNALNQDPISIIQELQSILQYLERKYTSSKNGMDYISARNDVKFELLELSSCQIQCIDISNMNNATRTAFCLNMYNIMIQHAFLKLGIATTSAQRSTIFKSVCYQIAGCAGRDRIVLSLDDIEHGILRANTKHPYALRPQFNTKSRLASCLSLQVIDPRIHFALNCGANSCPPINYYTPQHLNEELELAAMSFCNQNCNIKIDEMKNEISFSMILKWYKSDFNVTSTSQLPQRLLPFFRGDKKTTVTRMIERATSGGGSSIKVKFLSYDWGTNASRHESFDSRDLDTSKTSIRAVFKQYALLPIKGTKNALFASATGRNKKQQKHHRHGGGGKGGGKGSNTTTPNTSPKIKSKRDDRNIESTPSGGGKTKSNATTDSSSKPPLNPSTATGGDGTLSATAGSAATTTTSAAGIRMATKTLDRVVQAMFTQ